MDWEDRFYRYRIIAMAVFALLAGGSVALALFTGGLFPILWYTVALVFFTLWVVCFLAYDPSNKDR
jgi:TRAP-type C4-dicarboxylate transport system permease large subunit